ncbi:helix-turn-helix domain-containing protein [Lactococcus lactis]|uniref:helix-turn-helix domain-containing protein n=1 Tax=Lactococcus lactis TaxID=1358 RepID=UPI002891E893|nr:helix-turn-helix domain-containing protein [Lactococcus lactis]MDT2875650.1 helix-turn-helix domain-containing protein [Lactococcus lactis]MDT2893460.1 helix-turn-helix domain-containing protein [Lactococcus lactis]MDT2905594.1 helix-turn-helix domain-containing protein [Lactococcus lactis]
MKTDTSNRLKQIMAERNLKQVDILNLSIPFQKKFGIKLSKSTLSQYVNSVQSPDQNRIYLLAKTLGVSEAWLMGFDVPMVESSKIENDSETIEKTVTVMKKLEEPRQKAVLDTANVQLKEQEEQKSKIVSIKNEQEKFDLADLVDDSKVDWDKWVSFDGRPLTDEVKEAMKKALGKELEDK